MDETGRGDPRFVLMVLLGFAVVGAAVYIAKAGDDGVPVPPEGASESELLDYTGKVEDARTARQNRQDSIRKADEEQ